jgi:integral membrane protein (TIGR00529 family)
LIEWLGFFFAMTLLLIISKKNLGVAMFVGALILGVLMIPESLLTIFWLTITDPTTFLLAIIVGIIPMIGGILKDSGQLDNLVNNVKIGKKAFLMLSPALVGLLPMPGGALLSAPLIEKGGKKITNEKKAGINIWFRHVLYLVYPLAPSLIISTEVAKLELYNVIPYLSLILIFSLFLGYFFFLRGITIENGDNEIFSIKKLLYPLIAIIIAPILDILMRTFYVLPVKEIATFLGVLASLFITIFIGKIKLNNFIEIALKAKPWNFALMMIGIMTFLNVFKNSGVIQLMQDIYITEEILFIIGFLLGFGTGRIITPAGIIFPVFLEKIGAISLPSFTIIYFSIFLGYIITPVHPCVSLSVEYFGIRIKDYIKIIAIPTLIALIISFAFL